MKAMPLKHLSHKMRNTQITKKHQKGTNQQIIYQRPFTTNIHTMKKLFTLAFMALFCASAMAQSEFRDR